MAVACSVDENQARSGMCRQTARWRQVRRGSVRHRRLAHKRRLLGAIAGEAGLSTRRDSIRDTEH